ncbi:MAG: adenosylhomocysteinase [Clostridia bacterium]|nr:adenosylhomocysteinase [Clostridia bacterium]
MNSVVTDINLAKSGKQKIKWVEDNMPILKSIEKDFIKNKPLAGIKMLVSVHIEAKTARLVKLLRDGGATVAACGCNPLSTQDDVAAALACEKNIFVFAKHGIDEKEYYDLIDKALEIKPQLIIDDGGDIVSRVHSHHPELIPNIMGGCEETTTGVIRLKSMEKAGALKFPMVSVNDAYCKYLFDNRYGTGQSVWNGINRTTNLIVSSKTVVVAGYGWCGKGVAMRAKGLGGNVIICEVDPIKALEAVMDGFKVMPMDEASRLGDIFVTVTGCDKVITKQHFMNMKDGAVLSNAGHFDVEVYLPDLEALATNKYEARENITAYEIGDKKLYLLAEGRLVNLAAGDGHPAEIMDMSFGIQALSAKYMLENHASLKPGVYNVPDEIDKYVAETKLKSLGIEIDTLTEEQEKYLNSWA